MITSCQIIFFNSIFSDVFALDIEDLHGSGCDVVNDINGDMICVDMVIVGRRVEQGSVNSVEDHVFPGLQSLPCYVSQDLFAYAIEVLVRLNKVAIIAIMHEYAIFGQNQVLSFKCSL